MGGRGSRWPFESADPAVARSDRDDHLRLAFLGQEADRVVEVVTGTRRQRGRQRDRGGRRHEKA